MAKRPPAIAADYFTQRSEDLVCYNKTIYQYRDNVYAELSLEDFHTLIVQRIKNDFREELSSSYTRDVAMIAKANIRDRDQVKQKNDWISISDPGETLYINCLNGLVCLDIASGEVSLINHSSRYFTTIQIPHNFNPEAKAPRFQEYLNECHLDEETQECLILFISYLLTTKTSYAVLLILVGIGANGKSVFNTILECVVGKQNCGKLSLDQLSGENRFTLIRLVDKLLCVVDELQAEKSYKVDVLKNLVSGGGVTVEEKNVPARQEKLHARISIATNYIFKSSDKSNGLMRRMLVIPFERQFSPEEQDISLTEAKFWLNSGEAEGIFNFALQKLPQLFQLERFPEPQASVIAKETYRSEISPERRFLTDFYEFTRNQQDKISSTQLFHKYREYCSDNGLRAGRSTSLGKEVRSSFPGITQSRSPLKTPEGGKSRYWFGLKQRDDSQFIHAEQWNRENDTSR